MPRRRLTENYTTDNGTKPREKLKQSLHTLLIALEHDGIEFVGDQYAELIFEALAGDVYALREHLERNGLIDDG